MKTSLHPILSSRNFHPRDKNIEFFEEEHKYIINSEPDVKYTSVTTWVHEQFPKFEADIIIKNMMKSKGWKKGHKYWGLTPQQIKDQWNSNKDIVSGAGTSLHYEIECFNNDNNLNFEYTNKELYENYMSNNIVKHKFTSIEWQYFINFIRDTPYLKPFRTEWVIYQEDVKISGSIDMVYENSDGTLSIYDWKRSKNITRINNYNKFALPPEICHLPDSNFWHYALQLNTYKAIIEQKYGKKIRDLFLVRLHPDADEQNYELIKLPDLFIEIEDLFLERKKQFNN
jgi:ATP-dependent exoDNAse (exonuclease V) beta subunit